MHTTSETGLQGQRLDFQRWRLLRQVDRWLEFPLAVLGLVWLALLVLELVRGANPVLDRATQAIWIFFIAEFALRLWIAPRKLAYLRRSWFTMISLVLPALRIVRALRALRILRVLRAARGTRLLRILTSLNRGMRSLRSGLGRRGVPYVLTLTLIVILAGAAGMYAFEGAGGARGFATYFDALWWTAMLLTTIASESWPQTSEGRVLALLISTYAIAVFGYITAVLASFFVERSGGANITQSTSQADELVAEMEALRRELETLQRTLRSELATAKLNN